MLPSRPQRWRLFRHGLACLAAVFALGAPADEADVAATRFELKIGTLDLPPYAWLDEKQQKHGITYELNEEIGKRSGLRYSNQIVPAARLLESMVHGETHFVLALEKAGQLAGAEKLALAYQLKFILVTKKNSGIRSLSELNGKTVLVPRMIRGMQGGMQEYLPSLAPLQVDYVDVTHYDQTLKMLEQRKGVVAAVISETAFNFEMGQLGLTSDSFGYVLPLEERAGLWAFVQPTLPAPVKDRLRQVVEEVWREKLYYQIREKYIRPAGDAT